MSLALENCKNKTAIARIYFVDLDESANVIYNQNFLEVIEVRFETLLLHSML